MFGKIGPLGFPRKGNKSTLLVTACHVDLLAAQLGVSRSEMIQMLADGRLALIVTRPD